MQDSHAVYQNPAGNPPIVPPPFPLSAYGLATIDTGNNVLHVGGLQAFYPDGTQPATVEERIQVVYDSMYAIAKHYGASPHDALRFTLYVNPNAPIMLQQYPNLSFEERFNIVRDKTNQIQAGIYGVNGPVPARSIIGVTFIVLDDVFELASDFIIPKKLPKCKNTRIPHVDC